MKTTVELPDALYRQAKAEAVLTESLYLLARVLTSDPTLRCIAHAAASRSC